jgi:hypothetical protein
MVKGRLGTKLPSYGQKVMVGLGNETVDHSSNPGACEFETVECTNHDGFTSLVARGITAGGSVFPWFRAWIWKSCCKQVQETVAGARFAIEIVKNDSRRPLYEDEAAKKHTGL